MAPFNLAAGSHSVEFLVFLAIGMGFGAVLEASGFGDSRKLAAQFYLREMTVLKVMFTGIIVAAVLIHLASSLQWLDLQRVWVNPTYLWPGIVGGLVMGVGFIIGGFCPGTSLVAASTLKLDGIFFVLGGLTGVFLFGESVHLYSGWWHSSFLGRFTLGDWLHLPAGVVVVLVVLMALGMFVLAEASERHFGRAPERRNAPASPHQRPAWLWRHPARVAAGVLVLVAAVTAVVGQPDVEARWNWIADRSGLNLTSRAVFVDPAEVVDLRRDLNVYLQILEVRSEADYNQFHLAGSRRIDVEDTVNPAFVRELLGRPDNHIVFLVSNGEEDATLAWKRLRSQGVINLYVIEGGVNGWLDAYPPNPCLAQRIPVDGTTVSSTTTVPPSSGDRELLAWRFQLSAGERIPSAHPEIDRRDPAPACAEGFEPTGGTTAWFDGHHASARSYTKKVTLQRKIVAKGGCG